MKALTAIVLDKRRMKKDRTYPVKIRVTFQRKQEYYPTRFDLTEADFNKLFTPKPREEYKAILLELTSLENRAKDIIGGLKDNFNWNAFEAKYLKRQSEWDSVSSYFNNFITKLEKEGRISTSQSYSCSLNSLEEFAKKPKKLIFENITTEFLHSYEHWMLQLGNSITTVGIYLRNLRAVFNVAIADGVVTKDAYPFGKGKYEIPTGKNIKKALPIGDIGRIYNYCTESETEEKAKDFWLLSYLANGINMKDIALLKRRDYRGAFIVFERAKTRRSRRANPTIITIPVTKDIKRIINKWGKEGAHPDDYLFPILEKGIEPVRERKVILQFIKTVNKYMKKIAGDLKIDKHVTTYTARHSFSTVLKRSGASTEFISEALGHADLKTTQNYLDSFEDESKKEMAKALTAFKTEPGPKGKRRTRQLS